MIYPRLFLYGFFIAIFTFFFSSAALAFNLIDPVDNATGVKTGVYFKWQYGASLASLHHYQLEIHTAGPAAWVPINVTIAGHCSGSVCSVGTLEFVNTFPLQRGEYRYEWRVVAKDGDDATLDVSPTRQFRTESEGPSCPPDCPPPGGGGTTPTGSLGNPISAKDLPDLFNKIFSFLFGLAIFLVPVIVIYAAFLMLMGGGDPVKLAKGRMILMWTAIAFILILLAKGLPVVFKNLL